MQRKESIKSLRETYVVPKGEEQDVHYAIERVSYSSFSGERLSHYDIIKTNPNLFDDVKRNLELQGYTLVILHHPQGKYNEPIIEEESLEDKLEEQQAEIERLKAELAKATSKKVAKEKGEEKAEITSENYGVNAETANLADGQSEEKPKRRSTKKQ